MGIENSLLTPRSTETPVAPRTGLNSVVSAPSQQELKLIDAKKKEEVEVKAAEQTPAQESQTPAYSADSLIKAAKQAAVDTNAARADYIRDAYSAQTKANKEAAVKARDELMGGHEFVMPEQPAVKANPNPLGNALNNQKSDTNDPKVVERQAKQQAKLWAQEKTKANGDFMKNFGTLSPDGQSAYVNAIAQSMVDNKAVPNLTLPQAQKALTDIMDGSVYSKDKTVGQSLKNGARNLGALVVNIPSTAFSTATGALSYAESMRIAAGTGIYVGASNLVNAVTGDAKMDYDEQYQQNSNNMFTQAIHDTARYFRDLHTANATLYSQEIQDSQALIQRKLQEEGQLAGFKATLTDGKLATAFHLVPDLVAQVALLMGTGGSSAVSTVPQIAKAVAVPMAAYTAGSMARDMLPDEGELQPNQLAAITAASLGTAAFSALPVKYGVDLTALMAGIRNESIGWASKNTALRIAQAALVEAGSSAADSGLQAALMVAQGDKNNPYFTTKNVSDNAAEVYYAMMLGGTIGVLSGGAGGAFTLRSAVKAHQIERALEALNTLETPPNSPFSVDTQFGDTTNFTDQVKGALSELEVALNMGTSEADSISYINDIANTARSHITDVMDTLNANKSGDASIYADALKRVEAILANPNSFLNVSNHTDFESSAYPMNRPSSPLPRESLPQLPPLPEQPLLPEPKDGWDAISYAVDGENVKGGITNIDEGYDLVYDASSKSYTRQHTLDTQDGVPPITTPQSDYNNTAFLVADEVNVDGKTQQVISSAPVYERSPDGTHDYVGDFYVLRDDTGTDRPTFVPLEFNHKLRLGDGVRDYNVNHTGQKDPSIEVRRGDERFERDQESLADQASAQRAIKQIDETVAQGRQEASEAQAEAERIREMQDMPMMEGSPQLDYLDAVTPNMFSSPNISTMIMNAIRSGSEQAVIDTLNRIVYSFKPPKKTNSPQGKLFADDQAAALSLLKGNGHAVNLIAEHNSTYTIPLSSELMQLVDHTIISTPEIKVQPTSLLTGSITVNSKNLTGEALDLANEINVLLHKPLTLEEVNVLTVEQLNAIISRVYPHKVPKVVAELLIYADMNRPSTVSHSQFIENTISQIMRDPEYSSDKLSEIQRHRNLMREISIEFDARTQYIQPQDAIKIGQHTNDTTVQYMEALPFSTPISLTPFTHLSYLYNAEGIPQKITQLLNEREKVKATDISSDVLQNKILSEGLLTPEVRYVKYWESSEAKALMKGLRTEKDISAALFNIQQLALEPVIADSALGRDIYRAAAILEISNTALATVNLPNERIGVTNPSADNASVRTFAPSVTPLQGAVNEALFSNGAFLNDTPVTVSAKLDYSSNQVELNLDLTERVALQVKDDLGYDTVGQLTEVELKYVDAVTEYNHVVREILELDTSHDAVNEQLKTLESIKMDEGTSTKLEQSIQSASDQQNVIRSAIAERQVERLKILEKIGDLRDAEPSLYAAHKDNNFYQPKRYDEANITRNQEADAIINGEKDYAESFIESAVETAKVGITSDTLIKTVKAMMLKHSKSMRSVVNHLLGRRETASLDAWDYRNQPVGLTKGQRALLRSVDPVVREKIGRDAVHDVSNRAITEDNLTTTLQDFSLIDEGLGLHTTELIRNYVSEDGASRGLLHSQIDEFNFEGVYPKANQKLKVDSEGFVSIDSLQGYFSTILRGNMGVITADGIRAQAYLKAIDTARSLRTSLTGISYANPHFKVGNTTANQAHKSVGDALRNGTIKDALNAIHALQGLDPSIQRTTQFLMSTLHRFGDGILVKFSDPSGNTNAEYNYQTNTITFTGEAENIPYYVLHEVAHGLLDALYTVNENALTAQQLTAKKAITEIYSYARQENKLTDYSRRSEKEFFAEAMSNEEQARMLHELGTDGLTAKDGYVHLNRIRSMYDYFVEKIRDLFGWDKRSAAIKRATDQKKRGVAVDTVDTALSDIMSAVHLYSKPTYNKAASGKKTNQGNSVKAVTPAGEYVSGIDEVTEVIFIRDNRSRFGRNHIAGAITPTGARNRYELVLYGVDQKKRIIGTLPELKQQLNDTSGRYDFKDHINLKGSLANPKLAAKNIDYLIRVEKFKDANVADPYGLAYSEQLASLYLNGIESAPLPDFMTRPLLAYVRDTINADIRKYRKTQGGLVKGVAAPLDTFDKLPILARTIKAVFTGLNYVLQIPRFSSILDVLDVINQSVRESEQLDMLLARGVIDDAEHTTLTDMSKVNLLASHQQMLGAKAAYSQSRNSKLYQLHQDIKKLIPNATDLEEFSVWRTYKHAIERDKYHANHIRAGESKPTHFSGAQYAGKTGLRASEAIVNEINTRLTDDMKKRFDAADKLLAAEHRQLLKMQLETGYIDYATYAKFHTYDYYMPLVNRKGDAESNTQLTTDSATLQGRDTPPKNAYSSLMQYFNEANAEVQSNMFKRLLATQFERDMGAGVVNVAQGEIRIIEGANDNLLMRNTTSNQMADGVFTYRVGGVERTLKINDTTARGQALKRYLESLEPVQPYLKGNAFDRVKSALRMATVMNALGAVVTSFDFVLKTLAWNSFMPIANTQASYKVPLNDAMKISLGTYGYYLKNIVSGGSITTTQLFGTNSNPMFAYYQQQGGGLIGHALGGQEMMDIKFNNPSLSNALSGGKLLQDRFAHPLPETSDGRASLLADYTKQKIDSGLNFMGDASNIPDAVVRYSSWQSALMHLGTDKMKQAMRDGDVARLKAELDANPQLQAQLNAGSKQIIGNFQEQSMLRRFVPYYMFLNAGLQGVSLAEDMMKSRQGQLALLSAIVAGLLMAQGNGDDIGLDGKDKYTRERGANTGIKMKFGDSDLRVELDYALRPAYALGMQMGGLAFGDLTPTEAASMFGSVASDTFIPISGGDIRGGTSFMSASNATDLMNSAATLAPSPARSILFPLAYGMSNFSNDVDGTAFDKDGNRLQGGQPQEAYLSTNPIANWIVDKFPVTSGARAHTFLQGYAGEPYRLASAYTNPSLSLEDKAKYTLRSYFPEQNDVYRYRNDLDKLLNNITKEQYYASSDPSYPNGKFILDVSKQAPKIKAKLNRIKSDGGHGAGDIRFHRQRAVSDQERIKWDAEYKSLIFNQQAYAAKMIVQIEAAQANASGDPVEAKQKTDALRQAHAKYLNKDEKVDLLRIVGR